MKQSRKVLKMIWECNRKFPIPKICRYFDVSGLGLGYFEYNKIIRKFSDEDFDLMGKWDAEMVDIHRELEKYEYRQKRYSDKELLEIFPEAREVLIERLKFLEIRYDELYSKIFNAAKNTKAVKGTITYWFVKQLWQMWWGDEIEDVNNKIKKIKRALSGEGDNGSITQEMIDRAKEYPFENLIKVDRKGFASCPFHEEKTASFCVKNNFYYCFGCGEGGDTIKFVMKFEGLSFKQAILRLQ